jgi:hypothetical protein
MTGRRLTALFPIGCCEKKRELLIYQKLSRSVLSENELDLRYVLGLGPFGALGNLKADSLSFVQGFEASILDCREVNEDILATFNLDEAITLLSVEPLDFTFSQCGFLLLQK